MSSASPDVVVTSTVRSSNSFDALRLLAAWAVIIGHAHILGGFAGPDLALLGIPVHVLGVAIFFVISGWLITGSWERNPSVPSYITSRALRIVPLLWFVVLVSAFILGPLLTTLPVRSYLRDPQTAHYLVNLVLLPANGLPGVFDDVPYPGVINGSVWTLRVEVICYVVVLLVGLMPRRWKTPGFLLMLAGSLPVALAGDVELFGSNMSAAANLWVIFAIAALARLHLPRRWLRLDVALAILVLWGVGSVLAREPTPLWLEWVVVPYVVLSIGLAAIPVARRAARFGDLSYGSYLFAFPVTQLLATFRLHLPLAVDVIIVVVTCAVLSFGTWHLLEKPALDLRARVPWATSSARRPDRARSSA